MNNEQREIEQRASLAGNNRFELLLFRLGEAAGSSRRELFGINVFKVREILEMPPVTIMAGAGDKVMGVAEIRGEVIPVIDLAKVAGCVAKNGPRILLVTEFARTTQGFAVEEVEDIVRLEWDQVLTAEAHSGGKTVTSIARLEPDEHGPRLAQVLDVEQILRDSLPGSNPEITTSTVGRIKLPPNMKIIAADDSLVARKLIEQSLTAMGVPYVMCKTGKEAWSLLETINERLKVTGQSVADEISLVLTDLEMPEMDGFTLTRKIKAHPAMRAIPVVIHSSLSGSANEEHVRNVGADAYISKFVAAELADMLRLTLRPAIAA
jgi:two-component system chemotaxis response regulator CheV